MQVLTMGFGSITEFLLNLFKPQTRTNELEKYLESMKPQSPADVEFYIKKFDRDMGGRTVWWD